MSAEDSHFDATETWVLNVLASPDAGQLSENSHIMLQAFLVGVDDFEPVPDETQDRLVADFARRIAAAGS